MYSFLFTKRWNLRGEKDSLSARQRDFGVVVVIMVQGISTLAYGVKGTQVLGVISTWSCLPLDPLPMCLPLDP